MNKKFSLGVCLSLIAIACAVTFVLTMTLSLNMYNAKIAGVTEREEMYTKLKEIDSFIRNNHIYEFSEDDLNLSIYQGYASGTNDKQALYMTLEQYYRVQQRENGVIIGIGIDVENEASGYITVSKVYTNSPADNSGIAVGDVITAIDGNSVLTIGAEAAKQALEGDKGTRISITTQRDGAEQTLNLLRSEVEVHTVFSTIDNGVAYIRISSFNKLTADDFIEAINKCEADETVKGYIFDVRDCNSRYYDSLQAMLNRLIPTAVVATATYKDKVTKNFIVTDENESVDKPMTVLVNLSTGNAGELFAAALIDLRGAVAVGTNTAGSGIVLATQSFKDGSAVRISAAVVKSATTDFADGKGIKPEFMLETGAPLPSVPALPDTSDLQYSKAIEVLSTLNN